MCDLAASGTAQAVYADSQTGPLGEVAGHLAWMQEELEGASIAPSPVPVSLGSDHQGGWCFHDLRVG